VHAARGTLLPALAAAGAGAVWLQSTLLRELFVCFFGSELSFALALAFWLAGVAAGAGIGRRAGRARDASRTYSTVMLALAVAGAVAFVGLRLARNLAGADPGVALGPWALSTAAVLALAPTGLLLGASFPVACEVLARAGGRRPVASAYVAEGLGSFAGGLAFTFLAAGRLPQAGAAAGACLLVALAALFVRPSALPAFLAAAVAAAVALCHPADEALARLRWRSLGAGELLASVDTRYQNLCVARSGDQVDFYSNGLYLFSFPDEPDAGIEAAAAAAQNPGAPRALVIGASPEVASNLSRWFGEVVFVELDPGLLELLSRWAPEALGGGVGVMAGADGRRWLERTDERFDLILCAPGDPTTVAANRYFTEEFFRLAASRLAEGGVFATSVSSGSYLAGGVGDYVSVVLGTLRDVFPRTLATGGERSLLFGRLSGRLERDPVVLERSLGGGVPEGALRLVYDEELIASLEQEVAARPPVVNTDSRPAAFLYSLAVLLRRGGLPVPPLEGALAAPGGRATLPLLAAAATLAVAATASRGRRRAVPVVALGLTGFCAMGLWLLALYAIQSSLGSAYSAVGAATGTLMAGLAAGGLAGGALAAGRGTGARRALVAVDASLAALLFLLSVVLSGPSPGVVYYGALLLGAALVGTEFPLAARAAGEARKVGEAPGVSRGAGLAVLADNLGGCLGALFIGLLLVPVAGLPATALGLAGAKIITAAALALLPGGARQPR